MAVTSRRVVALLFAGIVAGLLGGCATPRPAPPPRVAPVEVPAAITPPAIDRTRQFVGAAEAMLGEPYRYGGAAPGGFDCSGLVVYAAKSVGLNLPRTTQEQIQTGSPVTREDVRAGDLVFMHLAAKELHVGVAVDHSAFVHAPSSGGRVRIDSLDTAPYAQGFLTARRLAIP